MRSTPKHSWVAILLLGGMRLANPALADSLPARPPPVSKFLALFDQLRAAEAHKAKGAPEHVAFQFSDAEINEQHLAQA